MCKQNTVESFEIKNSKGEVRLIDVDKCIAPIVRALNNAGVITIASCCGHGKQPSRITLADNYEIFIAPNFEIAKQIESLFPAINDLTDEEIRHSKPKCPFCGNKDTKLMTLGFKDRTNWYSSSCLNCWYSTAKYRSQQGALSDFVGKRQPLESAAAVDTFPPPAKSVAVSK